MEQKKYSIGLDIGTTSVGWAVIDNKNFKVIRKGNKKLWGVRLFDEADTAESRRNFRSTRRRYDRRRQRIKLLQEEFKDEINKVDSNFYTKLKEFFYKNDDEINKTVKLKKEDQMIFNKYKTIYHLRKELMENPEKKDIRLVYLAIHHIIKKRGNFLYNMDNFSIKKLNIQEKFNDVFNLISESYSDLNFDADMINLIKYDDLEKACLTISKNDKKINIKNCLDGVLPKDFVDEFVKLLLGNKFTLNKLFNIDNDEKLSISFKTSDYDDKYSDISKLLQNKIEILDEFKNIYDMIFLKSLFKDEKHTTLSSLMVSRYDKHHDDLIYLKSILSKDKKVYKEFFRDSEKTKCLYQQYISNKLPYDDFVKKVQKAIENILINESKVLKEEYELDKKIEMNNGKFMPKITDTENGKYPYQLNKAELIEIIENQGKYYPFLLNKVNDDYKIVKLLTFRIPYYVGPLNSTTSNKNITNKNAWATRKVSNVKITPYNFEEVVDLDKSAEDFITRMTSKCTYLLNEPALPNESIVYSKFKVLNELKQIKVNNYKLTNELINNIYKNLFLKTSGTINNKKFTSYLRSLGCFPSDELTITGYSDENKFANSMKSYVDFFGENGIFENTEYTEKDAEEIIKWITIFEDKNILERKVRQKYLNLNDEKIKLLLTKRYKGWGNLSEKLLTTKYYEDKETKIKYSIIDLLEKTEQNFMQIINDKKYNFQKMIDSFNQFENNSKLDYSVVDVLATSPSNKKGIYQALKIVKELVEYIGYEPENIMIEMARNEGEKKRSTKRKDYLLAQYKLGKNQIPVYNNLISQLKDKYEKELLNERLYLYFLQEGKSLYSEEPLDINYLDSYEVDHIIPRSLIKDNSIDNKALVLKQENQIKADSFVLPAIYRTPQMKTWWEHLKKMNLLSEKKYRNLIRYKYSPKDIEGFIKRQLVETRQITKHVANILKNYYKTSNIIYLHADLSSNFREKFELFKFRALNDYHHAHDAYLAANLGLYQKYIKKDITVDKLKEINKKLYDNGEYYKKKYGYVINSIEPGTFIYDEKTGEVLIDTTEFINTVEKTMYQSDILVSRKTEVRKGQFYKQTIYPCGKGTIEIKKNMPVKYYGGYSNMETSYMCLVKYKSKQKIIGIPVHLSESLKKDNHLLNNYVRKQLNLKDNESCEICINKIPYEIEIIYHSQKVYIKGYSVRKKNCELSNAMQLKIKCEYLQRWKFALNYILNDKKIYKEDAEKYSNDIILYLLNLENLYPLFKNEINKIKEHIVIDNLNLEQKCKLIRELLNLYHCNSTNANLQDFGLGDRIGRLSGKNIDSAIIINKSVTGIMERRKNTNEF